MSKLPPTYFPSSMSSAFFRAKKVLPEPDRGHAVMASFVLLPLLLSALPPPQLANCQIRKRASRAIKLNFIAS